MPDRPPLTIEPHPLPPFLPEGARLLMLGSFPPQIKRWGMNFYYPNPQNDMWRIMGLVFYGDRDKFIGPDKRFSESDIRRFCTETGIALSDTARAVRRLKGNASDDHLEIVERIDLRAVLEKLPHCRAIASTGQKAAETLASVTDCAVPSVGGHVSCRIDNRSFDIFRMPSSSRAYPLPLIEKAERYASMFRYLGMLADR